MHKILYIILAAIISALLIYLNRDATTVLGCLAGFTGLGTILHNWGRYGR